MKRLLLATIALSMVYATNLQADQEDEGTRIEISSELVTPTPEMWIYQQQMRRRSDPWEAIRRRAEYQSAQRLLRIASQRWYGYSPLRPTASPNPFQTSYSSAWIGNSYDHHAWRANSPTIIVLRPSPRSY